MRTVTVTAGETIQLGYQYDNEATQVVFPDTIVEAITDVFGTTGTFAIWYRRSGDALGYPIGYPLITYADDQVTWTLTEADMANPGSSQIQLRYIVDEVCVMSQMFMGNVSDSVDIGTDIPEPMEAWADALISAAVSGITDDIKDALLDCFAHVAWIDDQGQTYYDALEDALYPPVPVSSVTVTPSTFQISSIGGTQQLTATILPSSAQATVSWSSSDTSVATVSESGLVTSVAVGTATITATADGVTGTAACTVALPTLSSISAVYTQSGTVYNTDSLDSLKSDLVVTATYSDSSTATIPSTDYTLSGTLTVGTSTVTVSYGGKTATFNVTVTEDNRYVTANLVHHWDAIDNTGNGHSNSSQTWVDLVGSDFFTIVGSSITWGDNCLNFGGTNGDHLIGDEVAGACAGKTVEVVFAPDDDRDAGVACVFNNIGGTDSTGDYAVGKISMFRGNCVSGKGTPSSKIYPTGLSAMTDVRSVVCSYVDNSTISSLYVNGVKQTESNTTSSFKGVSGKRSAGASPTTYSYPFKGKMYAIRIYDAILSDADVARNYAIDVSRFNL